MRIILSQNPAKLDEIEEVSKSEHESSVLMLSHSIFMNEKSCTYDVKISDQLDRLV